AAVAIERYAECLRDGVEGAHDAPREAWAGMRWSGRARDHSGGDDSENTTAFPKQGPTLPLKPGRWNTSSDTGREAVLGDHARARAETVEAAAPRAPQAFRPERTGIAGCPDEPREDMGDSSIPRQPGLNATGQVTRPTWERYDGWIWAKDALSNVWGGHGCDAVQHWMRGYDDNSISWLMLRAANMTDSSGLHILIISLLLRDQATAWRSSIRIVLAEGTDGIAPTKCFIHLVDQPELYVNSARQKPRFFRAQHQPEIQLSTASADVQLVYQTTRHWTASKGR
ncbi:unnamed protein product, partial [Prorocentrum cordatum]